MNTSNSILRLPEVMRITGLAKPTLYRAMKRGEFPKQRKLVGARASGWLASEIQEWIKSRIICQ